MSIRTTDRNLRRRVNSRITDETNYFRFADHPEVGQTSQYKRVYQELPDGLPLEDRWYVAHRCSHGISGWVAISRAVPAIDRAPCAAYESRSVLKRRRCNRPP